MTTNSHGSSLLREVLVMEICVNVRPVSNLCVCVCVSVYNWSLQQVEDWLLVSVELPQYADSFRRLQLDGRALPRRVCLSDSRAAAQRCRR